MPHYTRSLSEFSAPMWLSWDGSPESLACCLCWLNHCHFTIVSSRFWVWWTLKECGLGDVQPTVTLGKNKTEQMNTNCISVCRFRTLTHSGCSALSHCLGLHFDIKFSNKKSWPHLDKFCWLIAWSEYFTCLSEVKTQHLYVGTCRRTVLVVIVKSQRNSTCPLTQSHNTQ